MWRHLCFTTEIHNSSAIGKVKMILNALNLQIYMHFWLLSLLGGEGKPATPVKTRRRN